MNTALAVTQLDVLAGEIDAAHKAVQQSARGMLLEAKRAGEALMAAKISPEMRHGQFKVWVKVWTRVTYSQAARYMKVAKNLGDKTFDPIEVATLSIESFLGYDKPKAPTPFTRAEAEYALKINALAERGIGGEKNVAVTKLASFAKQHGMTSEELVAKSKGLCPDSGKTEDESLADRLRAELDRRDMILAEMRQRFQKATKDELITLLADLKARGLWKDKQ